MNSHGYMTNPIQRSSLWRFNRLSPTNYDDNQVWCGAVHSYDDSIKCGICGDHPFSKQRHSTFGVYGNLNHSIGANLNVFNSTDIPVNIKLTANHKGYFKIELNKNHDDNEINFKTVHTEKVFSGKNNYNVNLKKLGSDCVNKVCVLRWTYITGNSWGCSNSKCGMGMGKNEIFRNCADFIVIM